MSDTEDMENYLSTYYDFEYEGQAKCNFKDGLFEDVKFNIQLLTNGRVNGDLEFITFHSDEIWKYYKEQRKFKLDGLLKESNVTLLADDCYLSALSLNRKFGRETTSESGKAKFSSSKVIFRPENRSRIPVNEILIQFGILNVYDAGYVVINTKMGKLEFGRAENSKEMAAIMTLFRIPLITSYATLTVQPSDSKLDDIITDSIKVIDNFLKITSLSQTVWHDWAFFIIYEKEDNSEEYGQIYRQLRSVNAKIPTYRQLVYDPGSLNNNNSTVQALVIANIADEILRKYGDAYDIDFDLTDMSNMIITNSVSAHGEERHSNNLENSDDDDELVLVNIWDYQSAQALSGKAIK
ncbi:MAG TPA: hypothetical protein VHH33_02320, partial [Nitrososphaeraceae archaeon]|nr:hypothetical protein [Nitrososphaeraceae archaeon]